MNRFYSQSKAAFLLLFLVYAYFSVNAQAPNISYSGVATSYPINAPISTLTPTNSGGAVTGTYGAVTTLAGSTGGYTDGTGTAATFSNPLGVAVDAAGNVYVADYYNSRIRKITAAGVVTTLAGNSSGTYADGTGTAASFWAPWGVAVDAAGNVYVGDLNNHRIRKITPTGVVTTLAGSGTAAYADGTGTAASFYQPQGVAVDAAGNVYVADGGNSRIRKITAAGVVTTLATVISPRFIALDAAGNVYVSDQTHLISKITAAGVVTTLAGSGTAGYADGTGTAASFWNPFGVAVDATGNVYVGDYNNSRIRKITAAGVVTTLTTFNTPGGVALDAAGNIYVANQNSNNIQKISQEGYSITPALPTGMSFNNTTGVISGTPTVATASTTYTVTATNASGSSSTTLTFSTATLQAPNISYSGVPTFYQVNVPISPLTPTNTGGAVSGTYGVVTTLVGGSAAYADGTGTAATFKNPGGVAVDAAGNVYVADTYDGRIRKIAAAGGTTTLAGGGYYGYTDGTGTAAFFHYPYSVAVDASGNVYVADYNNHRIRKITSAGAVTTLAGSGTAAYADGTGTAASFKNPIGVAVDASGNVYVADFDNNRIRKITAAGVVTTLAGSGTQAFADGTGTAASFFYPSGVAVDASGNVYVADASNHRIRKITSSGVVTTLAGSGTAGYADGTGTAASFYNPHGVAVDAAGNVYVADGFNHRIRKITAAGVVTTLAGSGTQAFADGTGTAASFYSPRGIAVDASGNVYVADQQNGRIRKISQVAGYSITPALPTGMSIDPTTGVISGTPTVVTASTTYTVTATNAGGSGSTTLTFSTRSCITPMTFNMTGGGAYCTGGTGVAVGLSNSQPGVDYQLKRDGNDIGSPFAGTGIAFSFGIQTEAGVYTCAALANQDACATPMAGSVTVTIQTPSTAPTSITGTTAICNGNSTTLTVQGGTLGVGATVEWFTGSCGGTAAGTGNSITVSPTQTTTYFARYKNTCNTTTCASVTVTVQTASTAPTSISGTTAICSGNSTTLTVQGGTAGAGATVEWFTGSCGGTAAGTGNSITVSPTQNTTYFVRYTGTCNTTTCASVTVTVQTPSTAPTSITGTTAICSGNSTTLTVQGGTAGTGATVQWFTGSCGGTAAGTGNSITVTPSVTTTYFARYTNACNTTTCASVTVTVQTASTAPTSISGTTAICSGNSTTLTVQGGTLGVGATVEWFTGSCGGTAAGTGNSITVSPTQNTTYFARYTGTCNTTTCASVTVTVKATSTAPTSISGTTTICSGNSTTLTIQGGSAGTGATVQWFTGSCGGTSAGTGNSITVSPTQTTTYFARYAGDCNTTTCASVTVTVNSLSTAPTSISGNSNICSGNSTTLTVQGGSLGTNASVQWFSGSCNGAFVGVGNSITVTPSVTTTYFVLYTGPCNTTTCASVTVNVNSAPVLISGTTATPCEGSVVSLSAHASGSGLSVRWERRGVGETSFSPATVRAVTGVAPDGTALLVLDLQPADNGTAYRAVFKSLCSTDELFSNPATVTYQVAPPIAAPTPNTQTIASGQSATLSVPSGTSVLYWEQSLANPLEKIGALFTPVPNSAGLTTITLTGLIQSTKVRAVLANASCGVVGSPTSAAFIYFASAGALRQATPVFPNPVTDQVNWVFEQKEMDGMLDMTILDLNGRIMVQKQFDVFKGRNFLSCNVENLPMGMFQIRLKDQSGSTQTFKFVKQ